MNISSIVFTSAVDDNFDFVVNTVRSVKLSDFKYPAKVEIYRHESGECTFRVQIGVMDVNPNGYGETWLGTPFIVVSTNESALDIINKVRTSLHFLVVHELDEQLLVDGVREFNPHKMPEQKFPFKEYFGAIFALRCVTVVALNEDKISSSRL